jgi:hypothetical protein
LEATQELDFSRNSFRKGWPAPSNSVHSAATNNAFSTRCQHTNICVLIIVEEFILPFLLDHAREAANEDAYALRALLN